MSDDFEFVSQVKDLASNGTLAELLRRLDADAVAAWRIARKPEDREQCWYTVQAIEKLSAKIMSFNTDDKVRAWISAKAVRRI